MSNVKYWSDVRPGQTGLHGLELMVLTAEDPQLEEARGHHFEPGEKIWKQRFTAKDRKGEIRSVKWHGAYYGDIGSEHYALQHGDCIYVGEGHSLNSRQFAIGYGMPPHLGRKKFGLRITEPWEDAPPVDPPVVEPDPDEDTLEDRVNQLEAKFDLMVAMLETFMKAAADEK